MKLHQPEASIYVPGGAAPEDVLDRITHLGIGAHPDDLEIMALHGILACQETRGFCGVVCTHGGEEIRAARRGEQLGAARIGRYGALFQLDYGSAEIKGPASRALEEDLSLLCDGIPPGIVYTHHPADRHETHVAVSLAVLRVLRRMPQERRPKAVYGVEVWGSLDWLPEYARVALDVSDGEGLSTVLIRVFRSQIEDGKRYDLATDGRRQANATFADPRAPDRARELCLAMDLTPLVRDPGLDVDRYVADLIETFRQETIGRLRRFLE